MFDRAELESLDRDALVARAESAGVPTPKVLTRPELVDELLKRAGTPEAKRARGWLGRARDLIARIVERGLHLPDSAERLKQTPTPPPRAVRAPQAIPTVTLAEIYAAQGHRERAIATLQQVLEREPDNGPAAHFLAQLSDEGYALPSPPLPPEGEEGAPLGSSDEGPSGGDRPPPEPARMLDAEPLPERYDVDECIGIPVDPTTLYVYWEVRDESLELVRKRHPDGTIALRVLIIVPTWDGPRTASRDIEVRSPLGDWFVRELPAGAVVRVAVGWRAGSAFLPFSHTPPVEGAPGVPAPVLSSLLARWTPEGTFSVPEHEARALELTRAMARAAAHRRAERVRLGLPPEEESAEELAWVPFGASDRMLLRRGGGRPLGASDRMLGGSERML